MKYQDETAFEKVNMFGKGMPNDAFAQYFVGNSYLNALRPEQLPGEPGAFNVTFEPGCRNNWHIHHAASGGGQILVCAAGDGMELDECYLAESFKDNRANAECGIPRKARHRSGPQDWRERICILTGIK